MIIRKPIGCFLVLLCCFLFSACGGDGDTAEAAPTEPTEPTKTDCVLDASILGDCTL